MAKWNPVELLRNLQVLVDWTRGHGEAYPHAQQARLHPELPGFLEEYYQRPLLRRGGLAYPVYATACAADQRPRPESALGDLATDTQTDLVVDVGSYLRTLRRQGKSIFNGRTYTMLRFESGEHQRLTCGLGYYFDAMKSCDVLEWETLCAVARRARRAKGLANLQYDLRLRNCYRERVPDPITDGAGRSAAMSISTLIVFDDGDTYQAFVRQRSGRTAAHSDLYHVIPSFMFQPMLGDVRREYSVRHNVFREYLEELFGVEEMRLSKGELALDWFYDHEELAYLRSLLDAGSAELLLTGFAVNMLNLRPEICTLLLIRDPNWRRRRIEGNWEFETPQQMFDRRQDYIRPVDVNRGDDEIAAELARLPGTFVPPGAAAFWLGVDVARERIAQPRPSPMLDKARDRKPTVFISARSADYTYARRVYEYLTRRGGAVFFSELSLPRLGNADFQQEIDRALDAIDHMVVVTSRPEHLKSPWVQAEWSFFVGELRAGRKSGNLLVIAARPLDPGDLPPALRTQELISLNDAGLEKLARYVGESTS